MGVAQQLVVDVEKTTVDEVVAFDAREAQREMRVLVAVHEGLVGLQEARAGLPDRPAARRRQPRGFVVGGQPAVVGAHQVVALDHRDRLEVTLPGLRVQARRALLVEPLQLPAPQHEDAAQNQLADLARVGLGIGQRQGRTPAAAENLPALHAQVPAQLFDVGHQVPGGVVHQVGVRGRPAGAALVEQDDPVGLGIVETPHLGPAARARPAVQQHHRLALGVAALFVIQPVAAVRLQEAAVVGFKVGVQAAHAVFATGRGSGDSSPPPLRHPTA